MKVLLLAAFALPLVALAQAPAPAPAPAIAAAVKLEGQALLQALRAGGLVLYVRHAKQGRPASGPCLGPGLTEEGVAQARKLGEALRTLAIPLGAVRASPTCRAIESVQAMSLGREPEITDDLNPGALRKVDGVDRPARHFLFAEAPKPGTNTLLVAHVQGSANPAEAIAFELGEVIAYRPDGKGGSTPVARIRLEDWAALGAKR